ncbi:MAG: hypothetical protein FD161_3173 [Limisphaerales bacterium]|nr:MAG: hypothetical protein FD161_3173 [Limisphaerales bacterium]KAG0507965.1 MAG: hypothetical protein E1N63_2839 [Limisphaerales bacterium]TXT43635.1 MAG: hypothetical protein FD140_4951 [Limisphaerales bacterium]
MPAHAPSIPAFEQNWPVKKSISITLIAAGAVLIALPLTYVFVLRLRGGAEPLPAAEMAACQFGGFSLVAGAILLALLLPEKRATRPLPSAAAPAADAKSPAGQTAPDGIPPAGD